MKLRDVMHKPSFISSDGSLESAAKLLAHTNANGLLVGNPSKVVGVVTKEDLVKHFGHKERVSEIMTKKVILVDINDTPRAIVTLLKKNRINFVPVVQNNKVVGVVSSKDFLKDEEDNEKEFLFD